jgi:hypothetical protein
VSYIIRVPIFSQIAEEFEFGSPIEMSTGKYWLHFCLWHETSESGYTREESKLVFGYCFPEEIGKVFGGFIPRRGERAGGEEDAARHRYIKKDQKV